MRLQHVLLALAAAGAAGVATGRAALAGERRLLARMGDAALPDGWIEPRFPGDAEIIVPTDDGAELVVARAGDSSGPTVVLVHGLTSNHHDWGPVAAKLVDRGCSVVAINQRGHGGSTVGSEGFGPARQGADLGQALTSLDLTDVTLVGHSMGGMAALSLMTLRPETGADRVGQLVAVATLAHATGADRRTALKIGNTNRYRAMADHPDHAAAMARLMFGVATPNRAMVDAALDSYRRCPFESRIAAAIGMASYDIRPLLGSIDVPTTVICGTADRLTRHAENRAIADAIPGARFISVPGAGHLIIWEESTLLADTIVQLTPTTSLADG